MKRASSLASVVAVLGALIVLAGSVDAAAQVRFRRPYTGGYRLGYGFDNNYGAAGCTDYGCGRACYDTHTGEDFALPRGATVVAGQRGTVSATFNGCANTGYRGNPCGGRCGNYVQIRHTDGSYSIYCHMELNSIAVRTGQGVGCGQFLGRSASSGSSTGPHLHFGYRPGGSSQEVFQGGCGRSSTRWVDQRGYLEAPGTTCGECTPGASRSCGTGTGACVAGTQRCNSGTWGACTGSVGPRAETCNGSDDDCDGRTDEALSRVCGTDVGECRSGTETCRGGAWAACEGAIAAVPERCDRLDNDCDGVADDEDVCEIEELVLQSSAFGGSTDVDGDLRSDACAVDGMLTCHLASGHGFERSLPGPHVPDVDAFNDPSHFGTLRMGDIDGDGRDDACVRGTDGVRCWRSDGPGDAPLGTELEGPALSDAAGFGRAPYHTSIRLADIDGDGMADLCARWSDGLRCQRSLGHTFRDERIDLPDLADDAGYAAVEHYGTLRMGDIDGDGLDDVCARNMAGVLCWRSTGRGFGPPIVGPSWSDAAGFDAVAYWSTIRLVDVDHDGRADLCARTPRGFQCHPATSRGFGDPYVGPTLSTGEGWDETSHYATLRLGDVDGDGRADLCARGRLGVACWIFDGRGFARRIEGPALTDAAGWTDPAWFRTFRMADINGDGRADLCARSGAGLSCWRSDGRGFPIEIPGPVWADGWDAPHRFGTIRLGGVTPTTAPVDPPPEDDPLIDGGCGCRTNDGTHGDVAWVLLALFFVRRREDMA